MNYFASTKNVYNLIKCTSKTFEIGNDVYELYSYTVKPPKKRSEDEVYAANPELLEILPRACCLLVYGGTVIARMEGPRKFSGRTNLDEDDETTFASVYNHAIVQDWAIKKVLQVTETEKANGKFAICTLVHHNGKRLVMYGSKNNHFVSSVDNLDRGNNDIISSIVTDLTTGTLLKDDTVIHEYLSQGYSLVGELCDGQHFTDGDNTIRWFGLFRDGAIHPGCLELIRRCLPTVESRVVFSPGDTDLDAVFRATRCAKGEGCVLHCHNIETGETILVKSKSTVYIIKRFMRQILLKGYKAIEQVRRRFVDAQQYHGLNTEASIRVTRQLMDFGFWMMKEHLPVKVLDVLPVESVRGKLPNGFNIYWKQYLRKKGLDDITLHPIDLDGGFDKETYLKETQPYELRNFNDPCVVVFLQGIQGSGKSTLGNHLCNILGHQAKYIEQDMFWGDTLACQGALYHHCASKNGPKVVIITRCNANPMHYAKYLEIAHSLPTQVLFFAPDKIDKLYLMVSWDGIVRRSREGDSLMMGRLEMDPVEAWGIITKTFHDFRAHPKAIRIPFLRSEADIKTTKDLLSLKCCDRLHELRLDVDTISSQVLAMICQVLDGSGLDHLVLKEEVIYIGIACSEADKIELGQVVDRYVPDEGFTTYIHHCTLLFVGGKQRVDKPPVLPGQRVQAHIDALVIRKRDLAAAFRIDTIQGCDAEHQAHITAKIPLDQKPMIANSFVGLTDDTVTIIDMDYPLEMTGFIA